MKVSIPFTEANSGGLKSTGANNAAFALLLGPNSAAAADATLIMRGTTTPNSNYLTITIGGDRGFKGNTYSVVVVRRRPAQGGDGIAVDDQSKVITIYESRAVPRLQDIKSVVDRFGASHGLTAVVTGTASTATRYGTYTPSGGKDAVPARYRVVELRWPSSKYLGIIKQTGTTAPATAAVTQDRKWGNLGPMYIGLSGTDSLYAKNMRTTTDTAAFEVSVQEYLVDSINDFTPQAITLRAA